MDAAKTGLVVGRSGLECPAGGFSVDPWRSVDLAIVTHAHADHARSGSRHYLASPSSLPLLRKRLGADSSLEALPFGERRRIGAVTVSLHPAGHIRGSAQVRIEGEHGVTVITGDFKRCADPTAEPFEVVQCDTFVTESTFGLPIYRWPDPRRIGEEVTAWWRANADLGRPSVLFCYALGKAQRLLAEVGRLHEGTAFLHGACQPLTELYREAGVPMIATEAVSAVENPERFREGLILGPPSAWGSPWMKRFPDAATGFASGWMTVRGVRRRKGYERGFVLSDHADWPGLLETVRATGARRILTMHGFTRELARHLNEEGYEAAELSSLAEREESDDG